MHEAFAQLQVPKSRTFLEDSVETGDRYAEKVAAVVVAFSGQRKGFQVEPVSGTRSDEDGFGHVDQFDGG